VNLGGFNIDLKCRQLALNIHTTQQNTPQQKQPTSTTPKFFVNCKKNPQKYLKRPSRLAKTKKIKLIKLQGSYPSRQIRRRSAP
jgi:hypothetical protein